MKDLHGAIGVTVTPFDRNWQVDLESVHKQAEHLAASSITGVFPCASTGEFPHLSFKQQREIYQATKDGLGGQKALIAGACAPNLQQAVAYAQMAFELGYDACVACPPYYYPLTQNEIYYFYRELAQSSPLPIIMYHVPFFTSGIEIATIEKLLQITNIIGLKDSSANLKRISHLCQLHSTRDDFILYTGTDDCLLPALTAGVDGSMTAFAAAMPKLVCGVYQAYSHAEMKTAKAYQQAMMPLLSVADALPFPLGYKLVAQVSHALPMAKQYHQMASQTAVNEALQKITTFVAEINTRF